MCQGKGENWSLFRGFYGRTSRGELLHLLSVLMSMVDQMRPHSPLFLSVLLLKCFVCLIAAPTKHKTYTIKWAISIQGFFVICGEFLLSNMFIMHIFIKTKTIQACSNRSTLEETNKQLMWSSSIWFWGGSWVFILIALSSMPKSILLIVRQTTQQSTK